MVFRDSVRKDPKAPVVMGRGMIWSIQDMTCTIRGVQLPSSKQWVYGPVYYNN